MPATTEKKQLLSRYLKDFKHRQTHCAHCGKELGRVSIILRGQLINKSALKEMDRLIDEADWVALHKDLELVCRFCSGISCRSMTKYFDIQSFKQFLVEETDVRHSTIREYVIRLRRLDEVLLTHNYPMGIFTGEHIQQQISEDFPDYAQTSYRSALKKYEQYLAWRKVSDGVI
ncbi:flagella biosynthesis regulatory protein FliZ [Affinibrenneria salicis]|uniref:Flagella biosynthesis regulatory protein FliZ n=1 Tax=Affinibrenneria salicis TaxID=2590031 RepID=A0A5J5FTK8_9GAMM|nr:flagella biosynthesis regulatory protein FliZ [Affinibrenneria salicis]KAA8996738.1 flagella biosynthesis regulatory protein FliZ [Affinibrenneria salicis]